MSWESAMGALNAACLAAFGREVVYCPAAGAPFTVTGVLETGARLEATAPGTYAVLFLRATDLPSPPERGDEVEVDGALYKVFEVESDAAGGTVLSLRR
jgi:hypothetical protein